MHSLKLFGETPSGKGATAGVIKELGEHCELIWEKVLSSDPETAWEGPLLEAPDGVYNLWQESGWVMLIISANKVVVEGRLIRTKALEAGTYVMEQKPLNAFRELLRTSEKLVHVYQDPGTGIRQYMFIRPEDPVPERHEKDQSCVHLGVADLESGRITP